MRRDFSLEIRCKRIVSGKARGKIFLLNKPLNFLGMVNTNTGEITNIDDGTKIYHLKNKILVFPNSIGSSVGAYTIFSLRANNVNPRGIICTNKVDITTASGCAISNIPLAFINNENYKRLIEDTHISFDSNEIEILLDTEREIISID